MVQFDKGSIHRVGLTKQQFVDSMMHLSDMQNFWDCFYNSRLRFCVCVCVYIHVSEGMTSQ